MFAEFYLLSVKPRCPDSSRR